MLKALQAVLHKNTIVIPSAEWTLKRLLPRWLRELSDFGVGSSIYKQEDTPANRKILQRSFVQWEVDGDRPG